MIFNQKTQTGLLLSFYLCASGRSTISIASQNLNISKAFLYQVARKLLQSGVLKSTRGTNGGYELADSVTVEDIIKSFRVEPIAKKKDIGYHSRGVSEQRALAYLIRGFQFALAGRMKTQIRRLYSESIDREMEIFDTLDVNRPFS